MKVSVVFGHVADPRTHMCARLNLIDQRLPVEFDWQGHWSISI